MSHPESHVHPGHENYKKRGETRVGTFAEGKVRQYDSYDPRLVIDIIRDDQHFGKLIADSFPQSELFGVAHPLDRVELIRGHHKARLLFAIGKGVLDQEHGVKYEVYSPDGLVGYAHGDNLDFYLASLFHDDKDIQDKIKQGQQGGFDSAVQAYLEQEIGIPNLFSKPQASLT